MEEFLDSKHVQDYNKQVQYLKSTKECGIGMKNLDISSLNTQAYCDASFACNKDLSSLLGFIIILSEKNHTANI